MNNTFIEQKNGHVLNRSATCADGGILGDFNLNLLEKPVSRPVSLGQVINYPISFYDQ